MSAKPDAFASLDDLLKSRKITLEETGMELLVYPLGVDAVESILENLVSNLETFQPGEDGKVDLYNVVRFVFDQAETLVPLALNMEESAGRNFKRLPIPDGLQLATEIVVTTMPKGIDHFLETSRAQLARAGIEFGGVTIDQSSTTTSTPGTTENDQDEPAVGTAVPRVLN
jgi:hypothetical protein